MTELIRVADEDPRRCKRAFGGGTQCHNRSVDNSEYCPIHQGLSADKTNKEKIRTYNLGKWQQRVNKFEDDSAIKSLRSEIGIVRMMLEEILLQCKDANDLICYSQQISVLAGQIERLVTSCHRMEEKTGSLFSRNEIAVMFDMFIRTVTDAVKDPEIIETIALEIDGQLCRLLNISPSNESEQGLSELQPQLLANGRYTTG